jgi:hypothetical protein
MAGVQRNTAHLLLVAHLLNSQRGLKRLPVLFYGSCKYTVFASALILLSLTIIRVVAGR